MSRVEPLGQSDLCLINTTFGLAIVDGPFAEDYTRLNWVFTEHRDGETARFRVAGIDAYVCDCDGDYSIWEIKDTRTRKVIATGEDDGFFFCLNAAENALRTEVERRKHALRSDTGP